MPKLDLSGAYGVPSPPPAAALANHPDRVLRYSRGLWLLWGVRLAVVGLLVLLLYTFHVV